MNWSKYLPTPKMARVLWGGLLTVALVYGLRFVGVDIADQVTAVAPWIVGGVWGWAKREGDGSPPLGDHPAGRDVKAEDLPNFVSGDE